MDASISSDAFQSRDITFLERGMEIRAFTISSSFEQHSSNFFASIKSSERGKWITLQKIAHSCQQKMRRINLPLERESDASEKKRMEKRKKKKKGKKMEGNVTSK